MVVGELGAASAALSTYTNNVDEKRQVQNRGESHWNLRARASLLTSPPGDPSAAGPLADPPSTPDSFAGPSTRHSAEAPSSAAAGPSSTHHSAEAPSAVRPSTHRLRDPPCEARPSTRRHRPA